MAIKLIANYSKRLGLPGFSSHQYSVSLETEIQCLEKADEEIKKLYRQLQRNIDIQLEETGFVPSETYGSQSRQQQRPQQKVKPQFQEQASRSRDGWQCSEKQESFIRRLVSENNIPTADVDDLAQSRFGSPARRLDKMQASGLIDALLDKYGSKGKGTQR